VPKVIAGWYKRMVFGFADVVPVVSAGSKTIGLGAVFGKNVDGLGGD
jgi:hypothetical protein